MAGRTYSVYFNDDEREWVESQPDSFSGTIRDALKYYREAVEDGEVEVGEVEA